MATSRSRNLDPGRSSSNFVSSRSVISRTNSLNSPTNGNDPTMNANGFLRTTFYSSAPPPESTLRGERNTLVDAPAPTLPSAEERRTVDDVWREIVTGERKRECKEEIPDDEMMTLEDFLVRAGASVVDDDEEEEDVKVPLSSGRLSSGFSFEPILSPGMGEKVEASAMGFGNGVEVIGAGAVGARGKRGAAVLEPLDKAAQQRQRRMIKNRESAARSRERKQAYQVELETMAMKLEEENEKLLKEKAERTRQRRKQLMEKVVPIVEKPKTARILRRVRSMVW